MLVVSSANFWPTVPAKRRVIRAEAAHFNGLENIGLFAAAVTAGNFAGLDNQLLNYLSAGYLASRIVYNIVYIHGDTTQLAMARTGLVLYISWAMEPMVSDYSQYLYDRNYHNHEPFCDEWQRDAERHNPQSYSIVFYTSNDNDGPHQGHNFAIKSFWF